MEFSNSRIGTEDVVDIWAAFQLPTPGYEITPRDVARLLVGWIGQCFGPSAKIARKHRTLCVPTSSVALQPQTQNGDQRLWDMVECLGLIRV